MLKVPVGTVIQVGDGADAGTSTSPAFRSSWRGWRRRPRQRPLRQLDPPGAGLRRRACRARSWTCSLELKLLADVGLVGLPNAGKSTLLRAVSNAMPDVADFPFTTLEPVLGVVDLGWTPSSWQTCPGLIEGAHAGVGLGHQFLRHVERTRVLVHLLDASAEDPIADYETMRQRARALRPAPAAKPEVIALNKIDLPERARTRREAARRLRQGARCSSSPAPPARARRR